RFKFTGREWDSEIGQYYYRARYYLPAPGRFITEDSAAFDAGDVDLYRYVANNPLNRDDPTGHDGTGLPNVPNPTYRDMRAAYFDSSFNDRINEAQLQADALARTAMYWYAAAAFNVGGARIMFSGGGWRNAATGRYATQAQINALPRGPRLTVQRGFPLA
ncbi:MAG: RHS repeat-associated core domain-containing protein, partial [Candidatus Acidiferrales bacterium]